MPRSKIAKQIWDKLQKTTTPDPDPPAPIPRIKRPYRRTTPQKTSSDQAGTPSAFIAYYRVSTTRQGESGLGMEAQRDTVRRYAGSVPIVSEYTEVESGKTHTNRPQLLAAINHAKRIGATLIIAKLDRLARNVHFISGLMESEVDFLACDYPFANPLTIHVISAVAQHERGLISQRTKSGLAMVQKEIDEKGFRISKAGRKFSKLGNPNWASALVKARAGRKYLSSPDRVLAIIKTLRADGKSFQAVADHLNSLGIHTVGGSIWYGTSVRNELNKKPKTPSK